MKSIRMFFQKVRSAASKGQTTTEYMLVISVLSIALLFSAQASLALFAQTMDQLTTSMSSSLTTDGIRP